MKYKVCSKCKDELPATKKYFYRLNNKYLAGECKKCHIQRSLEIHKKNPERTYQATLRCKHKTRDRFWEYIKTLSCIDCDNNDPRVLEFDHVRGKKKANLASMISQGVSWENILKEIAKCEVVCANCHRIRTIKRSNNYRNRR